MRFFLSIILVIFFCSHGVAQKQVDFDNKPSFKDRVYFGGGFGFGANSNYTSISLAPLMGYMVSPRLSVGVGITYQYYRYKNVLTPSGTIEDADDNRWGGNVFATFRVWGPLFAYADYNFINLDPAPWIEGTARETYTRFLLGGGVSQPAGRASINLFAAYDVLYDTQGPWGSPWVIGVFVSI